MEIVAIAEKKPRRFPWVAFIISITIMGILASIFIPAYQDYRRVVKWEKAISETALLKFAISKCLDDTKGKLADCNDFSADKLGKYHAAIPAAANGDVLSIFVMKNAGIKIMGASALGRCVVDFEPLVDKVKGTVITWKPIVQPAGEGGETLEKCSTYINHGKC